MTRITRFALPLALSGTILISTASAGGATEPSLGPLFGAVPTIQDVHGKQARHTFVGAVTGSNAYVAVVVSGRRGLVDVCDGGRGAAWVPPRPAGKSIRVRS